MRTAVIAAPSIELEQHAAQAGADSRSETALKRLRGEHAVPFREGFGIGDKSLRFLESFEHNLGVLLCYFEYNSTISCSFN